MRWFRENLRKLRPREVPRLGVRQHWLLYSDAYVNVETRECGIGAVLIGPDTVKWFGMQGTVDEWNVAQTTQPILSLEIL